MTNRKPDFIRGAEKADKLVRSWPLWKQQAIVIGLRDSIITSDPMATAKRKKGKKR